MHDVSAQTVPLRRVLSLGDAVSIGAAAMLGAGVFVVFGPASAAAGSLVLGSLLLAAVVATANAFSTAQLAAQYPVAGGAYVYGRERLGEWPGFAAGWMFVVGKIASCAAIALTAGGYLWPGRERAVAFVAVAVVLALNLAGVTRTARAARVSAMLVVMVLAAAIAIGLVRSVARDGGAAAEWVGASPLGVAQGAGLLFFAFAGYARVATLGEEVRDPARTIPRAVSIALGGVLLVYLAVGAALLRGLGVKDLARSTAPVLDLVGDAPGGRLLVTTGAVVACLGSLLVLMAGIGRTGLAMARQGDLPGPLARVEPRRGLPAVAEIVAALAVGVLVLLLDVRSSVAFSSAGVLLYYLVANLAALTQTRPHRRVPRVVPVLGALGCLTLVVCLPLAGVVTAAGLLALGVCWRLLVRARRA
ncbi:MAG TPA: amino acid permease [Micrococcales bacterium]|uniref:APC family permease n=1 Tax=Miniimonas TaxID=947525 RepID=UPI000D52588E|nr:amino acid permease [Micrococcales bacterium]